MPIFSSVNGFVVNITTNLTSDKVILRNLRITGAGTTLGVDAIRFLDGEELTVENVSILNFSGDGVDINQAQACRVNMINVKAMRNGISDGFRAAGTSSMNCNNCAAFANFTNGYNAVGVSANVRIIDSDSFKNATGIAGNVRSAGNNRFAANGVNGTPVATDITIQ